MTLTTQPADAARPKARRGEPLPPPTTTMVIVDDHPLVRFAVRGMLAREKDMQVVGEAADPATAFELIQRLRPNLVIVDLALEGGSGLDLIQRVKALDPGIRMLVLSRHEDRFYAERAIRAGAMGYVNKNEPVETMVTAIRRVRAGHLHVSDTVAEGLLRRISSGERALPTSSVETLSNRELQAFEMIGRGMSTRDIATAMHVSSKTIDAYRQRIKAKLGVANRTELIRLAVEWTVSHTK